MDRKKIKKIKYVVIALAGVACAGLTTYNFSNKSEAATTHYTFNDHVMLKGVGNYGKATRKYYIDSTASSYKTYIKNAMTKWVQTTKRLNYTTPISFSLTTTRSSSVVDLLATSSRGGYSENVLAWTEFYKKGGESINPDKSDWNYTYVKFYKANYNDESCNMEGTAAHEIGHCFGLAHNNSNVKSIMCQTSYGRTATAAQKVDLQTINYLY